LHKNVKEPYRFDIELGENDPSGYVMSVIMARDSGDTRIGLIRGTDGTWNI
jgi:hypothetical protein